MTKHLPRSYFNPMTKHLPVFTLGLILGALAPFLAPVGASPPPPEQTSVAISTLADREFVEEHEETVELCAKFAAQAADAAGRAALLTSKSTACAARAAAVGVRAHRGLLRYKPGLSSIVPAVIYDMAVGRDADSNGDGKIDKKDAVTHLHFNSGAGGYRAWLQEWAPPEEPSE